MEKCSHPFVELTHQEEKDTPNHGIITIKWYECMVCGEEYFTTNAGNE